MTFQPISPDIFPKRQRAAKELDIEAANGLYAAVADGTWVSDGLTYDSESKARGAARKAVRLLSASPDFAKSGATAHTKVGKPDGSDAFQYAIFVTAAESKGKGK